MTNKEVDGAKERLVEIQKIIDKKGRTKALQELAKEVGASIIMTSSGHEANEAELTHNIHYALQTVSMINMCKTATKNYEIASRATKIALGSAIAAWVAVLAMVLIAVLTR
jgi:hypothetical protein